MYNYTNLSFAASKPTQQTDHKTVPREDKSRVTTSMKDTAAGAAVKSKEREKMELPKGDEYQKKSSSQRERESERRDRDQETSVHSGRHAHREESGQERRGGIRERGSQPDRGQRTERIGEEGAGRQRGQGRRQYGRQGRRVGEEELEEYSQGKKSESTMLSEWFEQKLTLTSSEPNTKSITKKQQNYWEEDYEGEAWAYEESLAMAQREQQGRASCQERQESRKEEKTKPKEMISNLREVQRRGQFEDGQRRKQRDPRFSSTRPDERKQECSVGNERRGNERGIKREEDRKESSSKTKEDSYRESNKRQVFWGKGEKDQQVQSYTTKQPREHQEYRKNTRTEDVHTSEYSNTKGGRVMHYYDRNTELHELSTGQPRGFGFVTGEGRNSGRSRDENNDRRQREQFNIRGRGRGRGRGYQYTSTQGTDNIRESVGE